MAVQVSYTQRGFSSRSEYERQGGKTDTRDFLPDKLTNANVRCKNQECLFTNNSYTIEHIENRDLIANPLICKCGGKNLSIDYIKTNVLPLIYNDDNHRNAQMYTNVLDLWDAGKIYSKFETVNQIIRKLRSTNFYYGAQGKALYVDTTQPMMNSHIKDENGYDRTWKDFPWTDITVLSSSNALDPQLLITRQSAIQPLPELAFFQAKTVLYAPVGTALYGSLKEHASYKDLADYYPSYIKIKEVTPANPVTHALATYKYYIPAGCVWNYDNYSSSQKEAIDAWEIATGQSYDRKGKKYPATDQNLIVGTMDTITHQANYVSAAVTYSSVTGLFSAPSTVIGKYIPYVPEDQLELYGDQEFCDCINEDTTKKLPGVDPLLLDPIELPPIPLYIHPLTGDGSKAGTNPNPTLYTKAKIDELLGLYPWIVTTPGLIVDQEKKEGKLSPKITIPAAQHNMINILDPPGNCKPCLHQNNQMFSSLLYIIRQVDLEDPIYDE